MIRHFFLVQKSSKGTNVEKEKNEKEEKKGMVQKKNQVKKKETVKKKKFFFFSTFQPPMLVK